MAVSIHRLDYKSLSEKIFEWRAADRASLLALFMVMEVSLHWLWCLFVWLWQDTYGTYVDMGLLYPMWIGVTLMGLFFWWMVGHLAHIKNDDKYLHQWQIVLITLYSVYIAVVILVMGHSSFLSGVSLVGGAMLGMMLVRRRYIWKAFIGHITVIVLVSLVPYLGIDLPNLRQLTFISIPLDTYSYLTYSEATSIENTMATSIFQNGALNWENLDQLRLSSAFFWRSTHLYLALPKAIFIVYMFRTLLLILDNSKNEILKHANQDELTQLNSRRYGLTQMQQAIMTATDRQDFSVILLDLDLFKGVNDSYGHEVGDQVLREVGQSLSSALTDKAIVSRYGGEEFLIVLPNTMHDSAMVITEQLRQNIAQRVIKVDNELSFQVTASLGLYTLNYVELARIKQGCVTTAHSDNSKSAKLKRSKSQKNKPTTAHSLDMLPIQLPSDICQYLISTADKALYKAKDRGRNQVVSANDLLAEGHMVNAISATKSRYGT
ncbi:sensor domain-containing diguanylate cyclase [Psychrobacter sp. 72-O-c]|uniref:GGDEF domain-containing protein n=1 Tax=Psychrobacter sp. 72-O-c TaxID=2774125 RepID=UPI001919D5FC|nr:GGDEF domain-containing protein [Psychrobacter sp. 72-O-c]